jgi:hypothetical protein
VNIVTEFNGSHNYHGIGTLGSFRHFLVQGKLPVHFVSWRTPGTCRLDEEKIAIKRSISIS